MNLLFLVMASVLMFQVQPDSTDKNNTLEQKKLVVERLPDMNISRASHSILYIGDELTVIGGHTDGFVPTATAEYFKEGKWHLISTYYQHDNGIMVKLDRSRKVLIAGGHEKNLGIGQIFEAEMYDPETHTFDGFGCLDRKRALAQGVELDSGRVVIVGNHQGNDAFEMFDGKKMFTHVKDVSVWRSSPYILPISNGDAIVFGSFWNGQRAVPCEIVDRLKCESFRVPLLGQWMPILFDQNSHAGESFIGKTDAGAYSYIFGAINDSGKVALIQVEDTNFSLLPTVCPLPITIGTDIVNLCSAVADTHSHRVYLVGYDSAYIIYVFAVEYDKRPAPITLYVSDPVPEIGNCTAVLTPDGDLVVAGGCDRDNFNPLASVWLLHTGTGDTIAETDASRHQYLWWLLGAMLAVAAVVATAVCLRKQHKNLPHPIDHSPKSEGEQSETTEPHTESPSDKELMTRIVRLMEEKRLYLNPELKVADVAEDLGVHRNTVSVCINSQQGCTFSQMVNDYRLQHAKKLLREAPDMKIITVGLESGFANERSFFRAFKAATGLTPKEWQTQQHTAI